MRKILSVLLSMLCADLFACTIGTYEEEYDLAKAEYMMEVDFVKTTAKSSDLIFVGRVDGYKEDLNLSDSNVTVYTVATKPKKIFKGSFYEPIFRTEEVSEVIEYGCRTPTLRNSVHVYVSYTYLFYVKEGKILRVTPYDKPFPILTAEQEQRLVEKHEN